MTSPQQTDRAALLRRYSHLTMHNANEAETRKKLVDEILEKLLQWTPDDIAYEERVSEDGKTSYADYILRTANTALLIEAKRIGKTFDVSPSRRRKKLSGSILDGEIGDAIRQARDYCRHHSIPFAAVTNGAQWVVFPAVRTDEIPFSSSDCIIFDSLSNILGDDFEYFYSLLSRESVINGNLEIELIGQNIDQFETHRLNSFFSTGPTLRANPIYPLIESEINTAFTDTIAEGSSDLLEKCYVTTSDRTKFDRRIRMHLSRREPLFHAQPKQGHSEAKKKRKGKRKTSLDESLLAAANATRPLAILILGPVGAGKTTFLRYTRNVTANEYFSVQKGIEYPHWIEIDFLQHISDESELDFIVNRIMSYIIKDDFFSNYDRAIRSAYKEEISALIRGPLALLSKNQERINEKIVDIIESDYKEKQPYVEKLLTYAASKVPIFLVIDNVDQIEDEKIQSKIFSEAIAFAHRVGANLVLAMRESTFVKHRRTPTFDAFEFDPIQLDPPQIKQVLSRRFFVAEGLLSGKSGSFVALNGAEFQVDDLSVFLSLVRTSVLGTEVGNTIEILANGDVRLALSMTRAFLERGYTDPAKALQTHRAGKAYTLPRHEALRAILLSNRPVYAEEYSVIGNIFDARLDKTDSQLLRLYLLAAMVARSSKQEFDYLSGPEIRDATRNIGFSDQHVVQALTDLCNVRFAHTASHGEADFEANFFPSRLGGYTLRFLIGQLAFIENMAMDTFIADSEVWKKLWDVSASVKDERNIVERVRLRIDRAQIFFGVHEESL